VLKYSVYNNFGIVSDRESDGEVERVRQSMKRVIVAERKMDAKCMHDPRLEPGKITTG
jgi:hypothetical protein